MRRVPVDAEFVRHSYVKFVTQAYSQVWSSWCIHIGMSLEMNESRSPWICHSMTMSSLIFTNSKNKWVTNSTYECLTRWPCRVSSSRILDMNESRTPCMNVSLDDQSSRVFTNSTNEWVTNYRYECVTRPPWSSGDSSIYVIFTNFRNA